MHFTIQDKKMKPAKRVLIVTYHFHPDSAAGSRRPLSFARHLPLHGWQPLVLTVRPKFHESLDDSYDPDATSDFEVFRSRQWPNLQSFLLRGRALIKGQTSDSMNGGSEHPTTVVVEDSRTAAPLWKRTLSSLSCTPDAQLGWYPPAVYVGRNLVRQHQPSVVLATGPPWTALLIGKSLAAFAGKPLLADFRDAWAVGDWKPAYLQTSWSRKLELLWERRVLTAASAVTFVTESLKQQYVNAYPFLAGKASALYNGFEPSEMRPLPATPVTDGPVVIRHLGNLYAGRDFGPLLYAIKQLIELHHASTNDFRLENFGTVELPPERYPETIAKELGIRDCVRCYPPRDRRELREIAAECDALLAVSGPGFDFAIPYKVFEYLRLGRYIIAITPEGEMSKLIRSTNAGSSVEPQDMAGIKAILQSLLAAKRARQRLPGACPDRIVNFGAEHRVLELARILEDCSSNTGGSS